MALFIPIWKTNKAEKIEEAIAGVREIDDPKKLREIALSAYFPEIQFAALDKIRDPQVLKEVILANSTSYEVRRAAVRRISDPEVLAEIAMKRQAYPADGDAIALLSDQSLLKQIALSEQGGEQDKAVYKLTAQRDLSEIAVYAQKGSARKTAIRNITDPEILLEILADAEEVYTRSEAFDRLKKLRDTPERTELTQEQHKKLIDVIIHEADRNVRMDLRDLDDLDDLERIYRNAARFDMRAQALSKLVMNKAYSNDNLPEDWKTADNNRKTIHNSYSNPWQDAKDSIEARLADEEKNDPALLLDFIRDPEISSEFAFRCLEKLFGEHFQEYPEIDTLRDEAFAACLRNIPAYAARDEETDPRLYLLGLTNAILPELREQYGLAIFSEEYGNG